MTPGRKQGDHISFTHSGERENGQGEEDREGTEVGERERAGYETSEHVVLCFVIPCPQ